MDSELAKRKQLRLREFDYSTRRYYYVTICSKGKAHIFGSIVGAAYMPPDTQPDPQFEPTPLGQIVEQNLIQNPSHFQDAVIEQYVVMPNHIHTIISIGCHPETAMGGIYAAPTSERSRLTTILNAYKASVSRQYGKPVWQRSFYDHVIRNSIDYTEIAQ